MNSLLANTGEKVTLELNHLQGNLGKIYDTKLESEAAELLLPTTNDYANRWLKVLTENVPDFNLKNKKDIQKKLKLVIKDVIFPFLFFL